MEGGASSLHCTRLSHRPKASSSLVKLKISTGDNEAESAVIEIGMTDADFSGKKLGAGGALVVAAFLPKCK